MVIEDLSSEVRYQMFGPNGVLTGREMTKDMLVDVLWSDGSVPRWVDLSVSATRAGVTVVGIWHASDRVSEESQCVYSKRDQGPFGIKSPRLPPEWDSVEKSGRFSLAWRRANQAPEPTAPSGRGSS